MKAWEVNIVIDRTWLPQKVIFYGFEEHTVVAHRFCKDAICVRHVPIEPEHMDVFFKLHQSLNKDAFHHLLVLFPDNAHFESSNLGVQIVGAASEIDHGVQLVNGWIANYSREELQFRQSDDSGVMDSLRFKIIGFKGENVQKICKQYGVEVDTPAGAKAVTIRGFFFQDLDFIYFQTR